MDIEDLKRVHVCMERIRNFERAARKYVKAQPTAEESEGVLNRVFADLIASLEQPEVKRAVEGYLAQVHREAHEKATKLLADPETLKGLPMSQEWRVANSMGFSKRRALEILTSHKHDASVIVQLPATMADLRTKLVTARDAVIKEVSQLRKMSKKELTTKQKRRRKRDILRGTMSSAFGVGVIVGNSVLVVGLGIATGALSYALGGTALHQAGRDFIGEPA